jgi:hypothetical protein
MKFQECSSIFRCHVFSKKLSYKKLIQKKQKKLMHFLTKLTKNELSQQHKGTTFLQFKKKKTQTIFYSMMENYIFEYNVNP